MTYHYNNNKYDSLGDIISESRPKWHGRKVGHPIPNFQN